jgi:hypothetical protein
MGERKDPSCTHTAVVLSRVGSGRFTDTVACRICVCAENENYVLLIAKGQ